MKFSDRLDEEAIPEWRPKYMRYKELKEEIRRICQIHAAQNAKPACSSTPGQIKAHEPILPTHARLTAGDVLERSTSSLIMRSGALLAEEEAFFRKVEQELEKVATFYQDRRKEAIDRKAKIMAQLRILPAKPAHQHQDHFGAKEKLAALNHLSWRSFTALESLITGGASSPKHSSPAPKTALPHSDGNADDDGRVGSEAADEKSLDGKKKSREKKKKSVAHLPFSSLRHISINHMARMRIKKALLEFYRNLEMIKSFRELNYLGFAKILKKFDKHTCRRDGARYMEVVRKSAFWKCGVPDSLMSDIENIYCWVFTDGDRHRAMRKLRIPDIRHTSFHAAALLGGSFGGISLAIIYRIGHFFLSQQAVLPPLKHALLYIYLGLFLPFLMSWLFTLNAYCWSKYYINYRFIFEFDARHTAHECQYICIFGFFTVAYLLGVCASLEGPLDAYVQAEWQPWFIVSTLATLLFMPFPIMFRSSRLWFVKVMLRIITAPYYPVRFKDFFINDQLMSLVYSFQSCAWMFHLVSKDVKVSVIPVGQPAVWLVFLLACLPGTWRLIQCMRRFRDTKSAFPHVANAAKYFASLCVPVCSGLHRVQGIDTLKWVICALQVIASTYSLIWDVVMDFGCLQRVSAHRFLRSTLLFNHASVYYIAILIDAVCRYLWIAAYVVPGLPTTSCLAVIEVLRRFMWNFFRVEFEHINNCNSYKAVMEVQLPYATGDLFYQDMVAVMTEQLQSKQPDLLLGALDRAENGTGALTSASSSAEEEGDDEDERDDDDDEGEEMRNLRARNNISPISILSFGSEESSTDRIVDLSALPAIKSSESIHMDVL